MYISLFKEFVIEFLLEVGGGVFVVGVGVCEKFKKEPSEKRKKVSNIKKFYLDLKKCDWYISKARRDLKK